MQRDAPALKGPFIQASQHALAPSFAYTLIAGLRRDEFITRERNDYNGTRRCLL